MKRIFLMTMVVAVLAALFSCAHFGLGAQAPEVTLSNVGITGMSLFETTFAVELRVVNKNPQPLDILGSEGDFFLDGGKMITVVSADAKSIPGFGSEVIHATAHASNIKVIPFLAGILSRLQSGQAIQDVNFKLDGVVHLGGGSFLTNRVSFQDSGVFPLSAVQSLHSNLGMGGAASPLKLYPTR